MSLDEIYQELILDHFKHPRCCGNLSKPDREIELRNPLCGDQITLQIIVEDEKIKDIAYAGQGCSISQAAASLMSELVKGRTLAEVRELAKLYREMMRGEVTGDGLDKLGDARALEGIKRFTARIKCALLAWDCIERLINEYTQTAK